MKNSALNDNDIDAVTRALARVAPGGTGGSPSDAGARALLASITAEEPGTAAQLTGRPVRSGRPRRPAWARRPGRLALGLAASAVLAAGVVVGPSLLRSGPGVSPSYAVTKKADGTVYIEVRDFRDAEGLAGRLKELNVPAIVDFVPEGKRCREPRGVMVDDELSGQYGPSARYGLPENIPGERRGWRMRVNTRQFKPGETFVWTITPLLGGGRSTSTIVYKGPVAPCELVPDDTPTMKEQKGFPLATKKGGSLAGFRVDEKTVGEVLPEIRRRGLKPVFLIMEIAPGNPGGFGEGPTQSKPVGDDWVVWEAEDVRKGVVRLLVTDRRYDRNPVYGGPRDAVIKE